MKEKEFYQEKFLKVIDQVVLEKINENMGVFKQTFPSPSSIEQRYEEWENIEWTPGFWTGMLWIAYQITNDKKYLKSLKTLLPTFEERMNKNIMLNTHDIGFIYGLSVLPSYKLFGNVEYKQLLIEAGDKLMERYNATAKVFQAWGDTTDLDKQGRIIIDSMLNMPLLFEVSKITHNPIYEEAALGHLNNCKKYLIRKDFSSYHTYYFDVLTGQPIQGKTAQGLNDESTWARGQAWAVLGSAVNYSHTGDLELLEIAVKTAEYYFTRLPADLVPYWDLTFTDGEQPRDSSAGAILVCGLLEIVKQLPLLDGRRKRFEEMAIKIMNSLIENYLVTSEKSNGILKHGVYSLPNNEGVDECCIWGDYYFFEALTRMTKNVTLFW